MFHDLQQLLASCLEVLMESQITQFSIILIGNLILYPSCGFQSEIFQHGFVCLFIVLGILDILDILVFFIS